MLAALGRPGPRAPLNTRADELLAGLGGPQRAATYPRSAAVLR